MKNVVWFVFGIAGGFILAHLVNKDPRGHEILAEVDARIGEFTDRIGDAYREQESRFVGIVDEVKDAASQAAASAKDLAGDVVDAAKDAADTVGEKASDLADAAASAASDAVDSAKDAASDAAKAAKKLTD